MNELKDVTDTDLDLLIEGSLGSEFQGPVCQAPLSWVAPGTRKWGEVSDNPALTSEVKP